MIEPIATDSGIPADLDLLLSAAEIVLKARKKSRIEVIEPQQIQADEIDSDGEDQDDEGADDIDPEEDDEGADEADLDSGSQDDGGQPVAETKSGHRDVISPELATFLVRIHLAIEKESDLRPLRRLAGQARNRDMAAEFWRHVPDSHKNFFACLKFCARALHAIRTPDHRRRIQLNRAQGALTAALAQVKAAMRDDEGKLLPEFDVELSRDLVSNPFIMPARRPRLAELIAAFEADLKSIGTFAKTGAKHQEHNVDFKRLVLDLWIAAHVELNVPSDPKSADCILMLASLMSPELVFEQEQVAEGKSERRKTRKDAISRNRTNTREILRGTVASWAGDTLTEYRAARHGAETAFTNSESSASDDQKDYPKVSHVKAPSRRPEKATALERLWGKVRED